jgi:hypothetical protein
MINIIKNEDLFNHVNEYDVNLIGTNIYCMMTNGFEYKVSLDYPYVFNQNLETKYGDMTKLGTLLECANEKEPTFCLCYIVKGNFRPYQFKDYLDYEALEKCLGLVNIKYKGKNIACPLLGCSRFDGNGDREKVMKIFEKCLTDVDITIYDYHQKSRDEEVIERLKREIELKKTNYEEYHRVVAERKKMENERRKKNGRRKY